MGCDEQGSRSYTPHNDPYFRHVRGHEFDRKVKELEERIAKLESLLKSKGA